MKHDTALGLTKDTALCQTPKLSHVGMCDIYRVEAQLCSANTTYQLYCTVWYVRTEAQWVFTCQDRVL